MEQVLIPTKGQIMERLEIIPEALKTNEVSMLETQDRINELDLQIKQIENSVMQKIIDEVEILEGEEKPKKRFTNQQQRELAFEARIKDNTARQQFIEQKNGELVDLQELKVGHDFLERKFKAARTMAELIVGRD